MKHWEHLHVAKSLFTVRSNILFLLLSSDMLSRWHWSGGRSLAALPRCQIDFPSLDSFNYSWNVIVWKWYFSISVPINENPLHFRYRCGVANLSRTRPTPPPNCVTFNILHQGKWTVATASMGGGGRKRRSARHLAGDYGTNRHSDETTRRLAQSYRPQCQYERDAYYEIDT